MKKYILPVVNCIVICSLCLCGNLRDGTPIHSVFFIAITLAFSIFLIKLIKDKGNPIKINAMNKIITLTSLVLAGGFLYETITGNMISDKAGDILAVCLVLVGIVIWLYDYFIKPFKNKK